MNDTRPTDLGPRAREAAARLERAASQGLDLDLTRGKPSPEQLDLAAPLLEMLGELSHSPAGTDLRNYGVLEGLPEARALFADYLRVEPEEIWVQDNSSLRLMHDLLSWCLLLGTGDGLAWASRGPTRFLCPVPGYDRHFHLCAHLGIELVPVELGGEGPDLEQVRSLAEDEHVRGMFCVPRFSNPTGTVYSDDMVEALATMPTAAEDFRIFWDDAYARHAFEPGAASAAPLLEQCKRAGKPERAFVFGSTSKVTCAGGGVAMVAVAGTNQEWLRANLSKQSIGPNKLVQDAHVRFLGDLDGILAHMERHAELLRPRFHAVLEVLDERLGDLGIAIWTAPEGGYFVSLDTRPGCARRVVEKAAEVGVKLTPAGATYPYGDDPEDRNIRLAPSFPSVEDVRRCAEVVADCIVVVTAEKLGSD